MKLETFYRMLSGDTMPCQHCGYEIRLFDIMVMHAVAQNTLSTKCKKCGGHLPQMERRDYGVKRSSMDTFQGIPSEHSPKRRPLWMLKNI